MKVRARVKLLSHQIDFMHETAQYPALVGGFGSGKTEAGIFRTFKFMAKYGQQFEAYGEKYVFGIYEPTYDLIRLILYSRFEQILSGLKIGYVLNKSEKTLTIPKFNTIIIFRSMENEDKIVGYEHADFWIDELDTLKKSKAKGVFEKIIARNRLNKPDNELNTGCITTTPEGYRFVYENWKKTKKPEKYKIIKGRTENNIFLPKSYVEDLREQYPENLIEAYLNGEFVNLNSSNVYTSFSRNDNNTKYNLSKDDKVLHIGMDFNVGKMSAVIAVWDEEEHEILVIDEIFGALDTPEMIITLKEKYYDYNCYVYPDAAGAQRKSANASISDIKLLQQAGFLLRKSNKNPLIKDRVMSVNSMFKNAKGIKRLFINVKNCPILTENLEQQVYDPKTGQPDKTQNQDHMIDALGYLIYKLYPIKRQLFLN